MRILHVLHSDLDWWIQNIPVSQQCIRKSNFNLEIFTDASRTGWGGWCRSERARGFWRKEEVKYHVNYLELLAAFNCLRSFAKGISHENILLRIDNVTAVSCVNKMGSVQYPNLNEISRRIWRWCEKRQILVYASYISSIRNAIADSESRSKISLNEYEFSDFFFQQIKLNFGAPQMDLFATYLNKKCNRFVSWRPDPDSLYVDAFTIKWDIEYFYAFPPFCLVSKVLEKIIQDKATGIIVVPDWPSQAWYPLFNKLLIDRPLKFNGPNMLLSPFRELDPLLQKITLVVGKLYGGLMH